MKPYDEKRAAEYLGCSVALLRCMRRESRGPKYTRIGRLIRYPEEWLHEYVEDNAMPVSNSLWNRNRHTK
jgi:hypothetical protein